VRVKLHDQQRPPDGNQIDQWELVNLQHSNGRVCNDMQARDQELNVMMDGQPPTIFIPIVQHYPLIIAYFPLIVALIVDLLILA
jgi:hypothetical protein